MSKIDKMNFYMKMSSFEVILVIETCLKYGNDHQKERAKHAARFFIDIVECSYREISKDQDHIDDGIKMFEEILNSASLDSN